MPHYSFFFPIAFFFPQSGYLAFLDAGSVAEGDGEGDGGDGEDEEEEEDDGDRSGGTRHAPREAVADANRRNNAMTAAGAAGGSATARAHRGGNARHRRRSEAASKVTEEQAKIKFLLKTLRFVR